MKKLLLLLMLLVAAPCVRAAQLGVQYDTATRRMGPTNLLIMLRPFPGGTSVPIFYAGTNGINGLTVSTNGEIVSIGTNVGPSSLNVHGNITLGTRLLRQVDDSSLAVIGATGKSVGAYASVHGDADVGSPGAFAIVTKTNGAFVVNNAPLSSLTTTELLRVTSDGRLALGMTLPVAILTVSNRTATTPSFAVYASNNPTPALMVSSNGSTSLGTLNPGTATLLNVNGRTLVSGGTIDPVDNSTGGVAIAFVSNVGHIQAILTGQAVYPLVLQWIGGNVGIGTTTPANKLDVEGAVAIGAAYSGTSTAPTDGLIVVGNVGIGTNAPAARLQVTADNSTLTIFQVGTTNLPSLLNVGTNGNVGIGTKAPSAKLDVRSQAFIGPDPSAKSIAGDVGGGPYYASNSSLYITRPDSGNIDAVTVDTLGNHPAGIAFRRSAGSTASPTNLTSGDQIGYLDFRAYSSPQFWEAGGIQFHQDTVAVDGQAPGASLRLFTTLSNSVATERIRINHLGKVSIGTAGYHQDTVFSPLLHQGALTVSGRVGIGTAVPTAQLEVINTTANGTGLVLKHNDGDVAITSSSALSIINTDTTANNFVSVLFSDGDGASAIIASKITDHANDYGTIDVWTRGASGFGTRMTITADGNVGIGTIAPTAKLEVAGTQNSYLLRVNTNNLVVTNGNVGIGTTAPRATLEVAGGIIMSNTGSGLKIGPGNATLTNTLYASATLDFPSTVAGTVSDLPITVAGAADGDIIALGEPSGSIGPLTGVYNAWASNGVVYVRFANNHLVTAQDPASGVFKVRVDKFQ